MSTFEICDERFLYDGEPFRILSGAMHYFRIVPGYWRDRLLKLRACGFNTVETVIPWNLHEPEKGRFNFEGMADVAAYIRLAGELGLKVIIRPGPYVCTEWEFGGLPYWLLNEKDLQTRCMNQPFLDAAERYFDALFSRLQPLFCENGGPIIAVQVENEYGSYGDDKAYLAYLRDSLKRRSGGALLFTSDGPEDDMLQCGTLPDLFKTVNFGSDWRYAYDKLEKYQKGAPKICMEFWNGWFDHWGKEHVTRDPADAAAELKGMLEAGMSVNVYMFHGGTNFGFYNGANNHDKYEPTVTSYDYDAPVSENGALTKKFQLFQNVLKDYGDIETQGICQPEVCAFGTVELTEKQGLFEALGQLSSPVKSVVPLPMERVGQDYGLILYRTKVCGPRTYSTLTIEKLRDRAQIFVNGKFAKSVYREDADVDKGVAVDLSKEENSLDILVENMGRVNYGAHVQEHKGITEYVMLGMQKHYDWDIYPLKLDNIGNITYKGEISDKEPIFYRGFFDVQNPADTYFCTDGWQKGVVFINGFNIGRYWNAGPQRTLYIPAPLLKNGKNEIVVFELEGCEKAAAEFVSQSKLG